jgi:uncharacterized protein YuzE
MIFKYYAETDTLYIRFTDRTGIDAQEIRNGVVADFDEDGMIVGLEIDPVRDVTDVQGMVFENLPLTSVQFIQTGQAA